MTSRCAFVDTNYYLLHIKEQLGHPLPEQSQSNTQDLE